MNCLKTVSIAKEIGQGRMWSLSLLVMLLYFLLFYTLFQTFGAQTALVDYGFLTFTAGFVLIMPVHLLLHCLPLWLTGRRASIGVRRSQWPYFYYSVKRPTARIPGLTATLCPAVVITAAAVLLAFLFPAHTHFIAIISAVNFGLSTYDFFVARQMFAAPKEALIEENPTGFHVIQQTAEAKAKAEAKTLSI
ncbi:DUF3267 domain-containing protein [Alkalicoccus chagannorensis]